MKARAARKSSRSPGPSEKDPALRPTPRKLNRSTGTSIRASAFAAWNTALVCMVPPAVGSGCASTAMALGSVAVFALISPSSSPPGPGMSTLITRMSSVIGSAESRDDGGKSVGCGDGAQVTGALQKLKASAGYKSSVIDRLVVRDHAVELALTGHDERGRFDASAVAFEFSRAASRARRLMRDGIAGAATTRHCGYAEPNPSTGIGIRHSKLPPESPERAGEEQRAAERRPSHVSHQMRLQLPSRARRRDQDQGLRASGPAAAAYRSAIRSAERHAADDGASNACSIEHGVQVSTNESNAAIRCRSSPQVRREASR